MSKSFTSQVEYLSGKGDGVVVCEDGHTYFVPGSWPGDVIVFRVDQTPNENEKFGYASLEEIITPSPERVIPKCKYQGHEVGKCGGCPWMIGNYSSQLKHKEYRVKYLLEKSQLVTGATSLDQIVPSPKKYGYRNRCQIKCDGEIVGFVSAKSNKIVQIDECIVLNEKTSNLLMNATAKAWQAKTTHAVNYIDLDETMNDSEIFLNKKRAFAQGNNDQNEFMKTWIKNALSKIENKTSILELFAGSGNFTEVISKCSFETIFAAEANGPGIKKLIQKNIPKVKPIAMDLYRKTNFNNLPPKAFEVSTLLVDPPRDGLGASKNIIPLLSKLNTIVYISCNPETFVKDLRFIKTQGFTLKYIAPIDMFPHTHHVELLSILTNVQISPNNCLARQEIQR